MIFKFTWIFLVLAAVLLTFTQPAIAEPQDEIMIGAIVWDAGKSLTNANDHADIAAVPMDCQNCGLP